MIDIPTLLNGAGLAFLATLIASFSGGGASLILFPMLLGFVPGSYISLFIISKMGATAMTAISGEMHFRKSRLKWKMALLLFVSALLGTALGTYFLQYEFNEVLFKGMLTGILFLSAIYLFFDNHLGIKTDHERKADFGLVFGTFVFVFLINIFNGIFGGTGIFVTLLLVIAWRLNFIKAVGYTMAIYTAIGLLQVGYLAMTESFDMGLALAVIMGSLLGGWLGTRMQYFKGNVWVKRVSIVMMLAIGVKMLM